MPTTTNQCSGKFSVGTQCDRHTPINDDGTVGIAERPMLVLPNSLYGRLRSQSGNGNSGRSGLLRVLFAISLLWALPSIACGSFAPRPTPTPSPMPVATSAEAALVAPTETPTVVLQIIEPTATPLLLPTDTPIPQTTGLASGAKALITAPAGLNMRVSPTSGAQLVVRLGSGQRVTVLEGPTQAEGFTWWRIDDGQGKTGWVAERDAETVWLAVEGGVVGDSQTGVGGVNPNARPVNRAPRVGDRVEVTMPAGSQLTIRANPGRDAQSLSRVDPGLRFSVEEGPQSADGYQWYLIRAENGQTRGWAAAGDGQTRWLSPLE